MKLEDLSNLCDLESRSISAENPTGEKGGGGRSTDGPAAENARGLGTGWKVSPYIEIGARSTVTLAEISGPGAIKHIWLTPTGNFRFYILRFYWDGCPVPSVECPLGDFFAAAHITGAKTTDFHQISSLAVCVNPRFGMNCHWNMPFRESCRITLENLSDSDTRLYYQIDYVLGAQPENAA